jgi:transposase-like protein
MICGTQQQIAGKMSTNERTLRNWIKALEEAQVARKVNHGKSVEVRLCEPYFGYSTLPDEAPHPAVQQEQDSPKVAFLKTIQMNSEAVGAKVEIRITMP